MIFHILNEDGSVGGKKDATHVEMLASFPSGNYVAVFCTANEFMKLFNIQLHAQITQSTDGLIKAFYDRLFTADNVRFDDADVIAGVNYLAATGIITEAQAASLLAGEPI